MRKGEGILEIESARENVNQQKNSKSTYILDPNAVIAALIKGSKLSLLHTESSAISFNRLTAIPQPIS